jgi:very-short-patch-repair endonuclease
MDKGKTKETDIRIKNISLGNLKVWKNRTPEEKSSHMSKCLDKVAVFPNIPERKLFNIINNIYPNQFKLNVGSKVRIDGLKPDIIHTHKKIIVEMFGDYWHRNDNHKNRINKFNSLGWKCLVIWEKELKNEKVVINKIKEFYNG